MRYSTYRGVCPYDGPYYPIMRRFLFLCWEIDRFCTLEEAEEECKRLNHEAN